MLLAGSLIGVSLPTFLIGILLILVFAVQLGWLPSFGRGDTVAFGWWTTGLLTKSGLKALILPTITLSLIQMTLIMRLVRSEMLEVLRTDYIKFARARGLTDRSIHFGHALKNTLVPVITIIGLQLGAIIAFAIVTETVFQWPGMGLLFIQSVYFADIPVMAAYLCFIALVFVLINLLVDLLYYVVDPRLRIERTALAHVRARPRSPVRAMKPVRLHRPLAGRVHGDPPRPARAPGARASRSTARRASCRSGWRRSASSTTPASARPASSR